MSHIIGKSAYKSLEERINRLPMGAPPSETLYKILAMLFSEKEAALVAVLPIKPFTAEKAAKIWNVDSLEANKVLNELASRAILFDIEKDGIQRFMLPPPMAGFFEFSLMRIRNDIDQKVLSELLYQYINVEEDYVKDLFFGTETRQGRVFVQEGMLEKNTTESVNILDYERATHIIDTAEHISISMCYCRHKKEHLGNSCDAPMDICMSFGNTAATLIKHSYARRVDASECKELLHEAYENNLVQCGENVREEVSFICNCCGCCCEAMIAAKKFGMLHPVETTNFIPYINLNECNSCGKCVRTCPIEAISFKDKIKNKNSDENTEDKLVNKLDDKPFRKQPLVDESVCLGCGVCARICPKNAIILKSRAKKLITPLNSVHRVVMMAIEKGLLQEVIFDNKALLSHRALGPILGTVLKLPPIKRALASKQIKSIYLEKIIERMGRQ